MLLVNSLLGAFKLTKTADPDKWKYSGYVTGFDAHGSFSLSDGSRIGKNVTIFSTDMSPSVYIDNKRRYLESCQRSNRWFR